MVNSNALLLQSALLMVTVICVSQAQSSTTTTRPTYPPNWWQYFPWYKFSQQPQKYTPPSSPRYPPPPPIYPPPPPPPPPVPNYSDFVKNPANISQPTVGDYWYGWTNLGGAFRRNPTVANMGATNQVDLVIAVNRRGQIRGKTIQGTTVSKWVGLGDSAVATGIYPQGDLAAVYTGTNLYMYFIGYDGGVYQGPITPLNSPLTTQSVTFTLVNRPLVQLTGSPSPPTRTYINTPAAVYVSSEWIVFAIGNNGNLYAIKTVTQVFTSSFYYPMEPSATPLNYIFSPTAAVYNSASSGLRVVVAAVAGTGDLYYSDDLATNYQTTSTAATALDPTMNPLEVKCIEQPVAVSLGNSVEIYCRTGDMKFICITVSYGSDADYRELLGESLPRFFFGSNLNNVVYFTSKSSDGRVMRLIHS